MTGFRPDDDLADWDGAYVLGALNLTDRRAYETYLAANPARTFELTELAGMPGILNVLSREEALALTDIAGAFPADGRADGIVSLAHAAAIRQQRSRRTWLATSLASAAALLIVGGGMGWVAASTNSTGPAMQSMGATPREGVTAQLAVTEKKWGTQLNWVCHYIKDWSRTVKSYDMVVTTHDGAQQVVGSWQPAGDESTDLSAATSIATGRIRTVEIRVSGTSEPLAVTTLP